MYISKEAVRFRRDCLTLEESQEKIDRKIRSSGVLIVVVPQHEIGPVLICKQSAKLIGLDLETAAADAKYWWKTGKVPLRPTPIASAEVSVQPAEDWFNKGITYGQSRQWAEALACFEHVLELNPNDAEAWYSKAVALRELGRQKEELLCYDRAINLNDSYAAAWYNKGATLGNSGHFQEALVCFEEAWRLGFPQAAQAMIACREKLEQTEVANERRGLFDRFLKKRKREEQNQ